VSREKKRAALLRVLGSRGFGRASLRDEVEAFVDR
jgi:hypothetical protein